MACITESGRILDTSPLREGKGLLELVDGTWVPAISPVSGADLHSARVLSEKELAAVLSDSELEATLRKLAFTDEWGEINRLLRS